MEENATYSILSPEGFASILWKDSSRSTEAAEVMRITAADMKELNIVEEIIPEYGMADEDALTSISNYLKGHMKEFLKKMSDKSIDEIVEQRYSRFRKF
jgi:acetyl-CoA carboxylase carboxyl transferase subunit beta